MHSFSGKPHVLATEVTVEERPSIIPAFGDMFSVKTIPSPLSDATSEDRASVEILIPFIHSKVGRAESDALDWL